MESDILLATRSHESQNLNEWLSCNLSGRGPASCHKAIQILVGYTLSVTPFVTAASRCIKTEPHPFYTIAGLFQYDNRAPRHATLTSFTPTVCMPFHVV